MGTGKTVVAKYVIGGFLSKSEEIGLKVSRHSLSITKMSNFSYCHSQNRRTIIECFVVETSPSFSGNFLRVFEASS